MIEALLRTATRPSAALTDSDGGRRAQIAADPETQEWLLYLMELDHERRLAAHERRVWLDDVRRRRQYRQSHGGTRSICGVRVKISCNESLGDWRWRVVGGGQGGKGFRLRTEAIRDAARVLSGVGVTA